MRYQGLWFKDQGFEIEDYAVEIRVKGLGCLICNTGVPLS